MTEEIGELLRNLATTARQSAVNNYQRGRSLSAPQFGSPSGPLLLQNGPVNPYGYQFLTPTTALLSYGSDAYINSVWATFPGAQRAIWNCTADDHFKNMRHFTLPAELTQPASGPQITDLDHLAPVITDTTLGPPRQPALNDITPNYLTTDDVLSSLRQAIHGDTRMSDIATDKFIKNFTELQQDFPAPQGRFSALSTDKFLRAVEELKPRKDRAGYTTGLEKLDEKLGARGLSLDPDLYSNVTVHMAGRARRVQDLPLDSLLDAIALRLSSTTNPDAAGVMARRLGRICAPYLNPAHPYHGIYFSNLQLGNDSGSSRQYSEYFNDLQPCLCTSDPP